MLGCAVAADGTLSPVQLAPTSTRYPRGMELSPDGTELLVAGQGSGNLVTMGLGAEPGRLGKPHGLASGLPTPTTIAFVG